MSTTAHRTHHHLDAGTGASSRAVHFVGSLPPALLGNDRDTMQWFLDHTAGTDITGLPCDRDPRWIINWLDNLAHVPALHPVRTGASTGYDDMPTYRLTPGEWLDAADVSLHRASDTAAAMAARDQVHTVGRALPPHQVSIPNAFDLAQFCFGNPRQALGQLPVFRRAVLADVLDIHDRWGSEVTFQLETPATLATFDATPRPLWTALAPVLARHTARVITGAPRTARWTLHLCHGDLAHQPMFALHDLVPAVLFINALHKRLTKLGYAMPTVHIPMCTGTTGPCTDPKFYRALRHLRDGIDVIAGLVDERHPDDSRTALQLAEAEFGRPFVAVAAACGHGRRTVSAAADNTTLACELAHAHTNQPAL